MEQKIRKIIASLEAQFTGDEEHDLGVVSKYLGSLERSVETAQIAKAIGHYCIDKFPNSDIARSAKAVEGLFDQFHTKISKARECLHDKKFEEAVAIYRELIGGTKVEQTPNVKRFAFSSPFEEIIYRYHGDDDIKKCDIELISPLPFLLYYELGFALFELKRYDEAKEAYEQAIELNPVDPRPQFELIQIAKERGDNTTVRAILEKIYSRLYTRAQLGRFYREHCYLACLEGQFDLAVALIYASISYDDTPVARNQLNAIAKHKGVDLSRPNATVTKARLSAANIPLGPFMPLVNIALEAGRQAQSVYPAMARIYYSIAYDLTQDERIAKLLARL